jgi:hypothetical protein
MTDIIVKIMVELLSVLGLVTKQIQHGRIRKCTITCVAYGSSQISSGKTRVANFR